MVDKASTAVLDFSDVKDRSESGINKKRVPAGDYLAKVVRVEDRPTKETKEAQWMYVVKLQEKYTDRAYPFYCKLQANQLWKLRNLFLACGVAIPKKKVRLDPNKIVGKLLGVTLEDDEYDGKMQSVISETFPASELEGGDSDPEGDEEEEDEEEAPEDVAEDEEEGSDDEEDEEEEPEPAPAPRKRAAAKKAAPSAKGRIPGQRKAEPAVTDDELEELDLEDI